MRRPRVRSMSDHQLHTELLLECVEYLLEPFTPAAPPRRLTDLLQESHQRYYRQSWAGCTCSECMLLVPSTDD